MTAPDPTSGELDDLAAALPSLVPHPRLVELTRHLSGAPLGAVIAAVARAATEVGTPTTHDDRLEIVARALVSLAAIDLRDRTVDVTEPVVPEALVELR